MNEGPWKVASVAITGENHEVKGLPCQDFTAAWLDPDWGVILVVSDGSGSAKFSDRGSRIAVDSVRRAAKSLNAAPWGASSQVSRDMRLLIDRAVAMFRATVLSRRADPHHYASTLAIVVLQGDWLGIAVIGDAFVVLSSCDEEFLVVPPSQRGEYANETTFITNPSATPWIRALYDSRASGVFLSTDGLEKVLQIAPIDVGGERKMVYGPPSRPLFAAFFTAVRGGAGDNYLLEHLTLPNVRRLKGDDIGVAVAAR